MTKIEFSEYTYSDLKKLQDEIASAIKDRQREHVQQAREKILAIANEFGISIESILNGRVKNAEKERTQKVAAQYQNPENSAQTWSGRGRQPRWIAAGLADGRTLDSFRIK